MTIRLNPAAEAWADAAVPYFVKSGLDPRFAPKAARLYVYAHLAGYAPRITSLRRSQSEQMALQARYDALPGPTSGPKQGFLARPADNSKHTLGLAMDMPSNNLSGTDAIAAQLGLRVGSKFSTPDRGHYDLP